MNNQSLPVSLRDLPDIIVPEDLTWEGTFEEYLSKCVEHPKTVRTAHQRMYDALVSYGEERFVFLRENVMHYKVFEDPFTPDHRHAIYGRNVDIALMKFMKVLKAAAGQLGQEYRMYLLRGPVGTAKSTFADLVALALENYTKKPEGQLFSVFWQVDSGDEEGMEILGTLTRKFERNRFECPLHEEPLRVFPSDFRTDVIKFLNSKVLERKISYSFFVEGNSCPMCDFIFRKFMRRYHNDWKKIFEKHLRVQRYVLSKSLRQGIVVARPKSEKDQDVTEFLGSTNYTNLGSFGSVTDPRTFDFAGHFMMANRGFINYEEQLKFALAFLYDCLGASQEHRVQPKGFMEVGVDIVIMGSTNEPEYEKLQKDKSMEALRDRTVVVDVPYILKLSDEVKIYQKFFSKDKRGGKHLAPRTLYLASYWGLLTRLQKPKKANLDLRGKLKLYDGRQVEGFTEDAIKEFQKEAEREGLDGVSPRYIHDKISFAFMSASDESCVDFFSVLSELKTGLSLHQQVKSQEQKEEWENLIELATQELKELIAQDIQDAATEGEEELTELFSRYVDQITAHKMHEKIKDPITREDLEPDEQFMRSIEDKIQVSDHDDFRQKIINQMSKRALMRERDSSIKPFDFRTDERLYRALRSFLFDRVKEKISWERILSRKAVVDIDGDHKKLTEDERLIDRIKDRLIKGRYGPENESYCEVCAARTLVYFASIFVKEKKKN